MATEGIKESSEAEEKRRKSLDYSVKDGAAYATMLGCGNDFITPFAVWLGALPEQVAFLVSLPLLFNAFIQLLAVRLSEKFESRLKVIVPAVALQALFWIPIMVSPFLGGAAVAWLVFWFSATNAVGAIAQPAWTSLMGDLVHEGERNKYFSQRNKIIEFTTLLSTLLAGYALGFFANAFNAFAGFTAIFAVAMAARLVSARYLNKTFEPQMQRRGEGRGIRQFTRKELLNPHSKFGAITVYSSLYAFAVAVASPFFAVYWLNNMHVDYAFYGVLTIASSITLILSFKYWGELADRHGSKAVLRITSLVIPLIPLAYAVLFNPLAILVVELFSGIVWAGQRLSLFNLILETTSSEERTHHVAFYTFFNGIGVFLGGITGAFLSYLASSTGASFLWINGILWVFLASALIRFFVAAAFAKRVQEIKVYEQPNDRHFLLKSVTIYPFKSMFGELQAGITETFSLVQRAQARLPRLRR